MMEMKEYQFRDIMKGFYDGPHATPEPSDEGPIFLGIKNIFDNGGIDFSNIRHISENEYPKWTKRVVPQKNDLVFSYEATLHKYALIPEGFRGCLGRRMALIRVDKSLVCENYLYQYFLSEYWRAFVETIKISGSTVERISISEFPNYKISLPPLLIQQKIASILSAYDELIENNKQRIKLLEEMAEEIYKEWFVRLRFPNYENTEFVDGLPLGWEEGFLGELLTFKKGRNITATTITEGNVPVVAGGLSPAYFHDTPNTVSPTITVSASGASAGYVNFYFEDIWASDCSYLDTKATKFIYFSYVLMKNKQTEIFFLQKGSAQPHVYPKDIMSLKLVKPPLELIHKFETLIQPFFEEIKILKQKNQLLQQTRDLLLPRLISGKLSVASLLEDKVYKIGENEERLSMAAEDGI